MPRLTIYLTDDVLSLITKEIEDSGNSDKKYQTSGAVSRLIKAGSRYEVEHTVKIKPKRNKGTK